MNNTEFLTKFKSVVEKAHTEQEAPDELLEHLFKTYCRTEEV